jgi:hypothetical protein
MAVACCSRFLAKPAVRASLRLSGAVDRCVRASIQRVRSFRILVMLGDIAAAGRSGIEEMYGVPYLDVGCDVCFHVA